MLNGFRVSNPVFNPEKDPFSMKSLADSVERINPKYFRSKEKYLLYLRHLFAYEYIISELSEDATVLELGFGEGYGAHLLSQEVKELVALDVNDAVIAYSNEKYGGPNCRFQCYDGHKIPFSANHFDHVISLQVIEHVEDDISFVKEIHRVMKPGGVSWITTPNRTHRIKPGAPIWNKFHVREYYPEELDTVLRNTFDDASVCGIRGTDEVQAIEFARVKRGLSLRKMIPEAIKQWLDGDVKAKYSTSDYRVIEENVKESLDLLGICRK